MSQLEGLVELLGQEGTLAAVGEFELDSEKARVKMQKFQLEDPHFYVLEFVQAAHLLGATRIDIAIDADEVEFRFDGDSLTAAELQDIYSAAFIKRADDRKRAMRHFALAINAAQMMRPAQILIETGQGEEGVRLELRPGRDDELDERAEVEHAGTRIYLREQFRSGHLVEFWRNVRGGELEEKLALRERCRYSRLPIYLDGELISMQRALGDSLMGRREIQTDMESGEIGFLPDHSASEIMVMQNGVLVSTHHAKSVLVSARVLVDSKRLSKNLSQSAFVEDAAWEHLMGHVLRLELHHCLLQELSRHSPVESDELVWRSTWRSDWVAPVLRRLMRERLAEKEQGTEQRAVTAALLRVLERYPMYRGAVKMPHLELVDHRLSIAQIRDAMKSGGGEHLFFSREKRTSLELNEGVIVAPSNIDRDSALLQMQLLARYLGAELVDDSKRLSWLQKRQRNRERWMANPTVGDALLPDEYTHTVSFGFSGGRGQWGVDVGSDRAGVIYFFHHHRLLRTFRMRDERFDGIAIAFDGVFEISDTFDAPIDDGVEFFRMILAAVEVFPELMEHVARVHATAPREWSERLLLDYLRALFEGGLAADLVALVMREHDETVGDAVIKHQHTLGTWAARVHRDRSGRAISLSRLASERERSPQAFEVIESSLGAVLDVSLFASANTATNKASLRDILGEFRVYKSVAYIPERDHDKTMRANIKEAALDRLILLVGDGASDEILRAVITPRRMRDLSKQIRSRAARERFLRKDVVPVRLDGELIDELAIDYRNNEGVIGLRGNDFPMELLRRRGVVIKDGFHFSDSVRVGGERWGDLSAPGVHVTLLCEGREMMRPAKLEMPYGYYEVIVDAKSLDPVTDYSSFKQGGAYKSLLANIQSMAWRLLDRHVSRALADKDAPPEHLVEVWDLLRAAVAPKWSSLNNVRQLVTKLRYASIFPTYQGDALTYEQLIRLPGQDRRVYYVQRGFEVLESLLPDPEDMPRILVLPAASRAIEIIEEFLPLAKLVNVTMTTAAQAEMERARRKFYEQQTVSLEKLPARPEDVLSQRRLEVEDVKGAVGMVIDARPSSSLGGVKIELIHEGRRIQTVSRMFSIGRFAARVEVDGLAIDPSFSRAADPRRVQEVAELIVRECRELFDGYLRRCAKMPESLKPEERSMLIAYLGRVLADPPTDRVERAHAGLLREIGLFHAHSGELYTYEDLVSLAGVQWGWQFRRADNPDAIDFSLFSGVELDRMILSHEEVVQKFLVTHVGILKIPEVTTEHDRRRAERNARAVLARNAERAAEQQPEAEAATEAPAAAKTARAEAAPAQKPPARAATPPPTPQPAPPPERDPYEPIIEALRERLLDVRGGRAALLADRVMQTVSVDPALEPARGVSTVDDATVRICPEHRATLYAMRFEDDPIAQAFFASSVYSAINDHYEKITDDHEIEFQDLMCAALLASRRR